jgi:alcohol dehydrogenase
MSIDSFSIARLPEIEFGAGKLGQVPAIAAAHGRLVLLVTGAGNIEKLPQWQSFLDGLAQHAIHWTRVKITDEPSPEMIDDIVSRFQDKTLELVIGIGGGSVLDAAKAIAGLLPHGNSVMDHLEGVGPELPYLGPALPFIAIPTTAGTGSEATRNAVLSRQGMNGFKKSFRDTQLVPRLAVIDPELLSSCPPSLIAANGMDALTQLLESWVSLRANPLTDALAISGLGYVRDCLLPWYDQQGDTLDCQAGMAYAALLSGITLAQVGLGSVHGLASPLGAFYPIPHGVVCGTLVSSATAMNIRAMQARETGNPALGKYAEAGRLLSGIAELDDEQAHDALVRILSEWTEHMHLQRLSEYGVTEDRLGHIVKHSRGSSMKTNPIVLDDDEIKTVLLERL